MCGENLSLKFIVYRARNAAIKGPTFSTTRVPLTMSPVYLTVPSSINMRKRQTACRQTEVPSCLAAQTYSIATVRTSDPYQLYHIVKTDIDIWTFECSKSGDYLKKIRNSNPVSHSTRFVSIAKKKSHVKIPWINNRLIFVRTLTF